MIESFEIILKREQMFNLLIKTLITDSSILKQKKINFLKIIKIQQLIQMMVVHQKNQVHQMKEN